MVELVYSPHWFYGKDIMIDLVSVVVLLLIAFFALKYHFVNKKNRNYLHLAGSFLLLAAAFLSKILTYFTIYYKSIETKTIGSLTLTLQSTYSSYILYFVGEFLYNILTLIGLYSLYLIYRKKQDKPSIFLMIYLLFVSTYFGHNSYYIFHLTSFMLLMLITFCYYKNFLKNRKAPSRFLFYSFLLITLSQAIFMFIQFMSFLYAVAEITQLIGYMLLLIAFIMVLFYGKKTRQA